MFHSRALKQYLNLRNKPTNVHVQYMLYHILLITNIFDHFGDHHQGSFITVLTVQQTAKLCQ